MTFEAKSKYGDRKGLESAYQQQSKKYFLGGVLVSHTFNYASSYHLLKSRGITKK